MRREWEYVTGTARTTQGCSAGTRDASNDGKSVADFLDAANSFILDRRARGHGTRMHEGHALLTRDEVCGRRRRRGHGAVTQGCGDTGV